MAEGNGTNSHDVGALTRSEIQETLEREAKGILGVSGDEAFSMLDRGELEGTAAEAELQMLRFLKG
jgi:hypothetical protein